jgi:hypothetical protein
MVTKCRSSRPYVEFPSAVAGGRQFRRSGHLPADRLAVAERGGYMYNNTVPGDVGTGRCGAWVGPVPGQFNGFNGRYHKAVFPARGLINVFRRGGAESYGNWSGWLFLNVPCLQYMVGSLWPLICRLSLSQVLPLTPPMCEEATATRCILPSIGSCPSDIFHRLTGGKRYFSPATGKLRTGTWRLVFY